MSEGYDNLRAMYAKADKFDHEDGRRAYIRYHDLLHTIATHYGFGFEATVAAFCALSPNNDYLGNLRSLVSMLAAKDPAQATVSTYGHCKERAVLYLAGVPFLEHAKGPKIRAFYQNIVDPTAWLPVTVDGHIVAAYRDQDLVMKDALVGALEYKIIAETIRELASDNTLLPNQMQAVIWFTRKRVKQIKYDPQLDLLSLDGGAQKTVFKVHEIKPYARAA